MFLKKREIPLEGKKVYLDELSRGDNISFISKYNDNELVGLITSNNKSKETLEIAFVYIDNYDDVETDDTALTYAEAIEGNLEHILKSKGGNN